MPVGEPHQQGCGKLEQAGLLLCLGLRLRSDGGGSDGEKREDLCSRCGLVLGVVWGVTAKAREGTRDPQSTVLRGPEQEEKQSGGC